MKPPSFREIAATLHRAAPGVEYNFDRLPEKHPDRKHKPVILPLLALQQIGTSDELEQKCRHILETIRTIQDLPDLSDQDREQTLLRLQKSVTLAGQQYHQARKLEEELALSGWKYDPATKKLKALKTEGNSPKEWLNEAIEDWLEYLEPGYRKKTGDQTRNPKRLRLLIQKQLSRWIDPSQIGAESRGLIQKVISNYQNQRMY